MDGRRRDLPRRGRLVNESLKLCDQPVPDPSSIALADAWDPRRAVAAPPCAAPDAYGSYTEHDQRDDCAEPVAAAQCLQCAGRNAAEDDQEDGDRQEAREAVTRRTYGIQRRRERVLCAARSLRPHPRLALPLRHRPGVCIPSDRRRRRRKLRRGRMVGRPGHARQDTPREVTAACGEPAARPRRCRQSQTGSRTGPLPARSAGCRSPRPRPRS